MDPVDSSESTHITKIFVVGDQSDSAPVRESILRQQEMSLILEPFIEEAINRGSMELSDKVRNRFI